MIVCHCKKISDKEIKACSSLQEVRDKTKASTCCGGCLLAVCEIVGDNKLTYEYECESCKHEWELEQKISDVAITTCPNCKMETAKRLVSGGQGFQLKGSGWFNKGGY